MKSRTIINAFAVVAAIVLLSSNSFAAVDFFLKIEGIDGEAKGKKFTLTENVDGSFSVSNIPGGKYNIIYEAKPSRQSDGSSSTRSSTSSSTITLNFEAIVSPRDAASGLPTGKRQHKPMMITKTLDKASPQLARGAFVGGINVAAGDVNGDGVAETSSGDKSSATTYDLKLNKKI